MSTDLDAPKTLEKGGRVPSTRISDSGGTQSRVQRLAEADSSRSMLRTRVKGLVDGNPPYKASALRDAGRAHQCNVNWRTAESYLSQATGAFYDVFSETPTYATVQTAFGGPDEQALWSRVITEKFHELLSEDDTWDYTIQISQHEMVLYGDGPIWFNDADDWRSEAGLCGELLVPERAKSNTNKWEEAARLVSFYPHELYERIMHEKEAGEIGWDVNAVKDAIINAHPKSQEGDSYRNWEWHQQQLKNQAFQYSAESSTVECYHYFVREFPTKEAPSGGITHVIGLRSPTESGNSKKYLFKKERRFENWRQVVHPMYYANDGGGFHHSVTGMGVKMYSAMEYENRLLCNLADKTFAPDAYFKPTGGQSDQAFSVTTYGEYGKVPAGYDVVQVPHLKRIEDGIVMRREMQRTVASNLSQYRQELRKEDGNPQTATQIVHDAQQQARLGKTQLNRYYNQLDWLYAEKFRRASKQGLNSNMPGAKEAIKFQEACLKAGAPPEALRKIKSVKATRITGQGSEFMRQQSLEFLLGLVAMLPEQGRENLVADVIAARAGQTMVNRYFPSSVKAQKPNDHHALAQLQVAAMKEGVPPVITGTQNHVIYAQVFLQAGAQAVQAAVQGGANPAEALAFVELAGPAIAQHLDAIKADPTRKAAYDALEEQWQQLAKNAEQLSKQYQQAVAQQQKGRQAQQRARSIQEGVDPEMQLKAAEMREKTAMAWEKTRQSLDQKDQKHRQALALKDATTADEIMRRNREAETATVE